MKSRKALAGALLIASVAGAALATHHGARAGTADTRVKCKLAAVKVAPKLPAGYPKPPEVTYTSSVQAGPTLIVHGYFAAGLDEALNEYKAAVAKAHYVNLHTEHDPHDAEINYSSPTTTGQIALRDDCREANTTEIQITSRPKNPGTPAATVPAWFVKLRSSVNDLVRETANRDKDGSARALAELKTTFTASKAKLKVKAPDETAALTMWIAKASAALKAGNLAGAHTYAVNMTKELSDAADKITGGGVVPGPGIVGTFAQLKQDAHDLSQEVGFHDTPGTKRALATFTTDFNAHRAQIAAQSAKAASLISNALADLTTEVRNNDKAGIARATTALVAAVNQAAKLAHA
jgi:hypothetical protein